MIRSGGTLPSKVSLCLAIWKSFLKDVIRAGGQGTSDRSTPTREEGWHEGTTKTTIRAENEVEAHREANNYKVGQDFQICSIKM